MPWASATLAADADLSKWESRQPELGKGVVGPSGKSCYDGKRDVAKSRIGSTLRKRGLNPDGLTDTTQLRDAAALLELSLIYRDMAFRNDAISGEKADYYLRAFEDEMEGIRLDYTDPGVPDTTTRVFGYVPVTRG